MTAPTSMCRLCGGTDLRTLVDLGKSPLCESFLARRPARRGGAVLSVARPICAECLLAQLEAYVAPEEIFRDYAYFSVVFRLLGRARARYTEHDHRAARARRPTALSSSSPPTTATCSSTSCERGIPALGIDPAANVAEAATRARRRDDRRLLRLAARRDARRRRPPRRPGRREQRARAGAGAERLRRRDRDPARDARCGDDRGAASRPPDRGAAVRHDLPRALLVLLA